MTRRFLLAAAVVSCLSATTTHAQLRKPADTYLDLVAASKKATSFDQISALLSAELLSEIKAQPQKNRAEWFKYLKDTWNLTEIKFTRESTSDENCVLEATARTAGGSFLEQSRMLH